MILDDKPFDDINADDILSLIPGTPEGHRLDYKRDLPADDVKGIRDFLADISALANTAGGFLLYGIDERRDEGNQTTGLPKAVFGVDVPKSEEVFVAGWQGRSTDTQLIEPRLIPAPRFRFIDGFPNGKKVLLVSVQRSLLAPHWCRYQEKARKFYIRHECNNMLMDIGEIRHAFVEAKEVPQRIDEYRRLRVMQIVAGETPIELLSDVPILVTHLLPLSSFVTEGAVDITSISQNSVPSPAGGMSNRRFNADGRLFHSGVNNDFSRDYAQFFRDGRVEVCFSNSHMTMTPQGGILSIRGMMLEKAFVECVNASLRMLTDLGVQPPVYVGLSVLRVKGIGLTHAGTYGMVLDVNSTFDKGTLIVPTVTSETLTEDVGRLLRPAFDTVWQASGFFSSPHYDDEGNWAPKN